MSTLMQADLDPYQRRFRVPKWNSYPTVLDVPLLFRELPEFHGWTKDQHHRLALGWLEQARVTQQMYAAAVDRALRAFGDHGSLISGVVREHFPEAVKADLRTLTRIVSEGHDKSLAHWQASGRRVGTWRRMRESYTGC